MIEFVRSDAGTQFTSDEFQAFCKLHTITCELAAPKHQEMNSICESNWKGVKYKSSRLLIQAGLSNHFLYFARRYAIAILNVMPTGALRKELQKITTPFELVHGYKPSLDKYHTFGCPVVFKKYTMDNISSQQGIRGIFIGFPSNQAGYLLYLEKPLQGHGHFMKSKDVAFDDNFDSALVSNKQTFRGGLKLRSLGNGHIESLKPQEEVKLVMPPR